VSDTKVHRTHLENKCIITELYYFTFIIWCRENEDQLLKISKHWETWVEEHVSHNRKLHCTSISG